MAGLAVREQLRDHYWINKDPIREERLLWRAQTFRHLLHLLPGQSILELGCGQGLFTRKLRQVTRGENPITALTFVDAAPAPQEGHDGVDLISAAKGTAPLAGRAFDFVVAIGLLDKANCTWVLQYAYQHLKQGGQVVFYESNPWNPFIKVNALLSKAFPWKDERKLFHRAQLSALIVEAGFGQALCAFHDFTYAPMAANGSWLLQHLSILLENMPVVQKLAGFILVHAQKGVSVPYTPPASLAEHALLRQAISVVVPCHNEEMNLEPLVTRLVALYGEYLHEIVLVDDNSQDRTREVITALATRYPLIHPVFRQPPNGVGRAIRDGYRAASGRYILSMDCDFQHLLPELRDVFDRAAEGYDVVIGSRFSRYSILLNYPFQKIVANRAFHFLARLMLGNKFRDVTNNLKLFKREVVENLELTQPGFAVNAETGLLPLLQGYSIKEVPVSWINRTAEMGISSFKLAQVGGGYWQVLYRLWRKKVFASTPREFRSA